MKLQALALTLLATAGLATPVRRDITHAVYTLRLSSPDPTLNNRLLSTNGTLLGVYNSSPTASAIHFYPISNPTTGLSELRTTPSTPSSPNPGEIPSNLALIGANGLLDFASLEDPAAVSVPEGTTLDWTSFELGNSGEVTYAGKGAEGRWVVFPKGNGKGDWSVKWKGAEAWTTQNYLPVKVVYELVEE